MSVGTRSAIAATFITTLILPVVDSAHRLVGHAWKAGGSKQATCVPGQPVTINGKAFTCRSKIIDTVKIAPAVKLCPQELWWTNGKCVSRGAVLQTRSSGHPSSPGP